MLAAQRVVFKVSAAGQAAGLSNGFARCHMHVGRSRAGHGVMLPVAVAP